MNRCWSPSKCASGMSLISPKNGCLLAQITSPRSYVLRRHAVPPIPTVATRSGGVQSVHGVCFHLLKIEDRCDRPKNRFRRWKQTPSLRWMCVDVHVFTNRPAQVSQVFQVSMWEPFQSEDRRPESHERSEAGPETGIKRWTQQELLCQARGSICSSMKVGGCLMPLYQKL